MTPLLIRMEKDGVTARGKLSDTAMGSRRWWHRVIEAQDHSGRRSAFTWEISSPTGSRGGTAS